MVATEYIAGFDAYFTGSPFYSDMPESWQAGYNDAVIDHLIP